MLAIDHTVVRLSSASSVTILFADVLVSFLYVRSWRRIRASANAIPGWRLGSFIFGMCLVWVAVGSPLVAYDHELLTVHMIQHLLLMTFAPALILLGEPLLVFWQGWPRLGKIVLGLPSRRPFARQFARILSRPVLCWTVSALTLLGWHVPTIFTLGMHSGVWHFVEQASFLGTGFLFWWPVVQPWPTASRGPQWSILLYLSLATLPCDILSGFLVFSDRVVYPVYFSMPRHSGFSLLEDQQCAAALMWTCVTLIYLLPAAILSTRLLSPRSFYRGELVQSEMRGGAASQSDSQRLEAV